MTYQNEHNTINAIINDASALADLPRPPRTLVDLYKTVDLCDARFREIVERLSNLIYAQDETIRADVAGALCVFRPVPGYEWVALEGWRRSSAADLSRFAGAINAAFNQPRQITPALVCEIASGLFAAAPDRKEYADDVAYQDALEDHNLRVCDAERVIMHFYGVLATGLPGSSEVEPEEYSGESIDWWFVTAALYYAVRRQMPSAREI